MERIDFDHYTAQLIEACEAHPLVIGLVLMGSTADRDRIDEWSDHDFAVIVQPGAAEQLRSDLSWLPQHGDLASLARELHDGFCGLYTNGHVIEFGITDLDGLANWHANAFDVVLDRGGVASTMTTVTARQKPADLFDAPRVFAILLSALVVGAGRARRGEVLSASGAIRGRAVELVLELLAKLVPADRSALDKLDVRRRFEKVYPAIGAELERVQQHPPLVCASMLLDICERELGSHHAYPRSGVDLVRSLLD